MFNNKKEKKEKNNIQQADARLSIKRLDDDDLEAVSGGTDFEGHSQATVKMNYMADKFRPDAK